MKSRHLKLMAISLGGLLLSGSLVNANLPRIYHYGDYVKEENAYFVETIDDPAGLIKARKFTTPTDPKYSSQLTRSMGKSLIGDIESVWNSYTGKGTTVAIIDDGFDVDHPEYVRSDNTSAILSTSRYYYASGNNAYYKSYSSDPTCICEDWESDEKAWATHGTNTSTTAAAPINNVGGVGIAPDADILALKIDFSFVAIKAAIQYAIDQGVDVINMSLGAYAESFTDGWGEYQSGSSSTSTYLNAVCQSAYNAGIIVIAAAGNESTWHKSYPACNSKVIGVGALGDWDNKGNANALAEFTNYVSSTQSGEINVDILAPGYVYTATQGGSSSSSHTHIYEDTQGTSFSSPIVAGAACLWKEKHPTGTPTQFLNDLQSSAAGIGTYKNKYVPVSGWDSSLSDVGPSNIECGRLDVGALLDINDPYVSLEQDSFNISVGEKKKINIAASSGTITYSTSNADVATVDSDGLVVGEGEGNATITVTASKNAKTATATLDVTVIPAVATTSLAFSPKAVTMEIGDTYDSEKTISVTPSNASRLFLFESKNESVATVDEDTGLVTAVSSGTANINVIPVYGEGDDTLVVTVNEPSTPTTWDKVTSTSDITNGDYLIVYESGSKAFDGSLSTLDAPANTIGVSISNNSIAYSVTNAASKFTINSVTGGYSIKSASGYYIGRSANSNGIDTSTSDAYVNSISINDGNATIAGTGGKTLLFNTNSGQERFRYYSNGGQIQLYKAASSAPAPTPTVTSVTVSPATLSLEVGGSSNLTATVNGTDSPAQTVTWTTSNSGVATVNNGHVVAIGVGSATITATSTADPSKSGTCAVTVTEPQPITLTDIAISDYKTSFKVGHTFAFGGTVMATFSDSTHSDVTDQCTFSGYNMNVAGTYTVTVSYTYEGVTKTKTYSITVSEGGEIESQTVVYSVTGMNAASVSSGTAAEGSSVTFYNNGSNDMCQMTDGKTQTWTFKGYEDYVITSIRASLKRSSKNGSGTAELSDGGDPISLNVSEFDKGDLGTSYNYFELYQDDDGFVCSGDLVLVLTASSSSLWCDRVEITYGSVAPTDKVIESLSASYSGSSIFVGGSLDASEVSVTAYFTDTQKYPSAVLKSSDYSLSALDSSTAGSKTITVTYTGSLPTSTTPLTTTFTVTVVEDTIENVSIACSKVFHPGETIQKSDLTVTATFASEKQEAISDYAFADEGYQFLYEDTAGGSEVSHKQFAISVGDKSYNFSVDVSRVAYANSTNEATFNGTKLQSAGVTGTGASGASDYNSLSVNGVTCAAENVYVYTTSGTKYISFGKEIGSLYNVTPLSGSIAELSLSRASSARTDEKLYVSEDGSTWVAYNASNMNSHDYRYFKVATESASTSYSNFNLTVTIHNADTALNVANYIMYEDTANQCLTKLDEALVKLNAMSESEKDLFWTSEDYVIAKARERIIAWAAHQGVTLNYGNNTFTLTNTWNLGIYRASDSSSDMAIYVIPLLIAPIVVTLATAAIVKGKKKK